MASPYLADIRLFAGNFAPRQYALCWGQLMAISQNDALFSLLGTIYGGDGRATFGLPDMRGRIPVHQGRGNGLSDYRIGTRIGAERITLTLPEMPNHSHNWMANGTDGGADTNIPAGNSMANVGAGNSFYETPATADKLVPGATTMIGISGGSQSHTNMMPTQCVTFIMALTGVYPSRN